jgi:hypothetical protein
MLIVAIKIGKSVSYTPCINRSGQGAIMSVRPCFLPDDDGTYGMPELLNRGDHARLAFLEEMPAEPKIPQPVAE